MLCKSFDKGGVPCPAKAVVEVFWPGQKTVACARHLAGMERMAAEMGFRLSSRPLIMDRNCDRDHDHGREMS